MVARTKKKTEAAAGKLPWPPMLFATALVWAYWFSFSWPVPLLPEGGGLGLDFAGASLVVLGVATVTGAASQLRRAGTAISPAEPTKKIVHTGLYGLSRNPIYAGMAAILAGIAILLNSAWYLAGLAGFVVLVTLLAIRREEAYLEGKFGLQYTSYRDRVRRWL